MTNKLAKTIDNAARKAARVVARPLDLTADGRFRADGIAVMQNADGTISFTVNPAVIVHKGDKGTQYVARMPGSAILPGGLRISFNVWYPGVRGPKPAIG